MLSLAFPDYLVDEIILSENLVQHDLDIMRGVPIAVVIKRPCILQNAGYFHTTRPHDVDVGSRRFVPIFKGALLFRLTPKHLVISVGIERRVDVDQIDALIWKPAELVDAVPTTDDLRIDFRRAQIWPIWNIESLNSTVLVGIAQARHISKRSPGERK